MISPYKYLFDLLLSCYNTICCVHGKFKVITSTFIQIPPRLPALLIQNKILYFVRKMSKFVKLSDTSSTFSYPDTIFHFVVYMKNMR